ncbi:MAG: hypothetical protein J3R72DRAFT_375528 [Linnemannia gamsii]|nr:MAG: hypothetical protein J3R72DRAFT_375528 [Linnemannia gamsii]
MNSSSRTKFNYYHNNISSVSELSNATKFRSRMIGRDDIEGLKSNVAMNA